MGQDVSTDRFCWVAPHGVGLGVNLVRDQHKCVVHVGEFLQVLQMTVQLLLSASKHAATNEFSTEVTRERINDDHFDVEALAHALDFVSEEHLVSRVVRTGDVNAREDVLGVKPVSPSHLRDSLGTERVFGVDVEHISVQTALVQRLGAVDGQLVPNLRLSAAEFTVNFDQSLGLKPSTEQVVNRLDS